MSKILFHHDKASSHTSIFTTSYLDVQRSKYGLNFLDKQDIPVRGADISPMDFFGFGFLKQKFEKTNSKTLRGLWVKSKRIWSTVTPEMCMKVLRSWKISLNMVYKKDGGHVEHIKQIHKRKVSLQQ